MALFKKKWKGGILFPPFIQITLRKKEKKFALKTSQQWKYKEVCVNKPRLKQNVVQLLHFYWHLVTKN